MIILRHNLFKLTFAAMGSVFLAGCSDVYQQNLPPVKQIQIQQTVEFEPGYTRVFIQQGKIKRGFDHYDTNCNLEIRRKDSENAQTIEPGTYLVTGIRETLEHVVSTFPKSETQIAGIGIGLNFGNFSIASGISNSPSYIYRGYHFNLSGADNNLMRLSCRGVYDTPANAELPALKDMRQALGDIVILQ